MSMSPPACCTTRRPPSRTRHTCSSVRAPCCSSTRTASPAIPTGKRWRSCAPRRRRSQRRNRGAGAAAEPLRRRRSGPAIGNERDGNEMADLPVLITGGAGGVTLAILSISYGAPLIVVVGLKPIAAALGADRSVVALAGSLTWLGTGAGGI